MATIFKRGGKGPYIIRWFDASGRRCERSSRTTDKRTAERIAQKLEADVALQREGVVDPQRVRLVEADRVPLEGHLGEYLEHLRLQERSGKHVTAINRHVNRLIAEAGISRLSQLSADLTERFLGRLEAEGRSARTRNAHHASFRGFGNWLVKRGRLEANPFASVARADEERGRRRVRRALIPEEVESLLLVADRRGRRGWYAVALWAGLRRSELARLTWGDIDQEERLVIVERGKARRRDEIPLHPELVAELDRLRPAAAHPKARVFPKPVTDAQRRSDFLEAKIPTVDDSGRVADLHSLRGTLGTLLARHGVAPQLAQKIMRHTDYRVTLRHYTTLRVEDTRRAIDSLPGFFTPTSAAATGTLGGVLQPHHQPHQNPHHQPHQSGRESVQSGASQCSERSPTEDGDQSNEVARNPLDTATLRDPGRPDATRRTGARGGTRTPTPREGLRILNPPRLPIPPPWQSRSTPVLYHPARGTATTGGLWSCRVVCEP